jgi:hypothetical protein
MNSILAQGSPALLNDAALVLPELGSAQAGFPSPAADLQEKAVDVNNMYVSCERSSGRR